MDRSRPRRVSATSLRLARLRAEAIVARAPLGPQPKVLLHGAVLHVLGHPGADVLMQLAAIGAALLALPLADHLPAGLERVRSRAPRGQRDLGAVDGAIDDVKVGGCEAETAGIDLVQVAEDLELELGGEGG